MREDDEAGKSLNTLPENCVKHINLKKWFTTGTCIFFLIITALIYSNAVNVPFYLDDAWSIVENYHIRLTDLTWHDILNAAFKSPCEHRPLPNITFALNYYFHGYEVTGYHLVNIVIHIINGILFFLFIRITLRVSCQLSAISGQFENQKPQNRKQEKEEEDFQLSAGGIRNRSKKSEVRSKNKNQKSDVRIKKSEENKKQKTSNLKHATLNLELQTSNLIEWLAFAAALIWLVHPLCTESVTYIIQRMNSMAVMYYLLSFLCYIGGRLSESRTKKYFLFAGCAGAGICALGSKQIAVTLPVFILLYEWYFLQDLNFRWLRKRVFPLAGVFLFIVLVVVLYMGMHPIDTILSNYNTRNFTLPQRVMTEFRVVILYISLLAFPHPSRLNLDYDFPLSYSLFNPSSTIFSLGIIIVLFAVAVKIARKERLISFCIIWFFGNLVLESSFIGLELVFEHRTYLPSMMAVLLAVLLVHRFMRYRWLTIAILCVVVTVFSFWTYQRNGLWADELAFWQDVVRKSPEKSRPHNNVGNIYASMGELEQAITHYAKAIQFEPRNVKAWFNMGNTLLNLGESDEAIKYYTAVLKIDPGFVNAYNNLGTIYFQKGDYPHAVKYFKQAIALDSMNAGTHYNLAIVLERQGRVREAIEHYRNALRIRHDYEEAQKKLRVLTEKQKKIEDAIEKVEREMENDPENPALYSLLGDLYGREGDYEQSISHYRKALQLKPDSITAMNRLSMIHTAKGEYEEALKLLKSIIEMNPDAPEGYYNIACVQARTGNIEESLAWLEKSVERGFDNIELMKNDPDLANVREAEGFKDILNFMRDY